MEAGDSYSSLRLSDLRFQKMKREAATPALKLSTRARSFDSARRAHKLILRAESE